MSALTSPAVKLIRTFLIAIGLFSLGLTATHSAETQSLPMPPAIDLKFFEFFKMPIGPRGLQPTEKLVGLDGKRVRILGYMAKQEQSAAGMFLLTPLPVSMGDEDEGLADDLPPSTVFVHF